ncbi:MAG: hypothetical protein ACRBBW_00380 [Cellvibrionaceae bacterium]
MKHFISSSCARAFIVLMFFAGTTSTGRAETSTTLKWHGYLSQGLIHTSDNNFYGDSEDVSWEFTDIAIGANWRPMSRLQLSAQALYRQAGATSRDDVYLDYALIDYTLSQSMSHQVGLRGGRIKNPYGLFNDTRDIANSRPSILLPESIYRDPIRDIFHTSDSASVYGHVYFGDHLLQWDLLHGEPILTDAVEDSFIIDPLSGSLRNQDIAIGRVLLESFGGSLRLAYTYTDIHIDYQPAPGSQQIEIAPSVFVTVPTNGYPGETHINVNLWSLEYNTADWQFNAEYQELDYVTKGITAASDKVTLPTQGYYVSAHYRFDEQWRAFVRYDVYHGDKNDKDGKYYEQQTGLPDHNRYAYDTTIGARYAIDKHWLLSLEYHRIKGTGWLSSRENDLSQAKEKWNLFSAQISYKF